ncbi:MAG: hypothetical protein NC825_05290 [Candidatus Omnitrophica bacterium]|nr:hypothetical protein [Candidatus Omnitrophota bacterium]
MNIKEITEFFKKSVEKNRVCHAIIIYGGSYETRSHASLIAAKILECQNSPEICGKCYSCRTIESKNYPDLHIIKPEKRNLSIDEVRSIKEQMYIKPYLGRYRIFVIESDWMQAPAANSLLKILEEPPAYGIIIILTRNNKNFVPTIVSRAINLRLNIEIENLEKDNFDRIQNLINSTNQKKLAQMIEIAGEIAKDSTREEIEEIFDTMILSARHNLLENIAIGESPLHQSQSSGIIKLDDYRILSKILDKRVYLKFNVNIRMFLEVLALYISVPKWRNWQTR